nr:uncharacterized protein LOC101416824 isoform X1 [Dasypus novemcinctus]
MQMLKYKVDNVCSQIQTLSSHMENTSADIRKVKGVLEDAGTCHIQTQMLRISLEEAVAEIQGLRRALEKANMLNSQTQDFLQSSSENTSFALHMLCQDLENANAEIQLLKLSMSSFSRIAVSSTVGACITFLMTRSVRRRLSSSVHPKELTWHRCPLRKSRFLSKDQLDNWTMGMGTRRTVSILSRCGMTYNVMPPTSDSARNPWVTKWPECRAEPRGPSQWPALGLLRAACEPLASACSLGLPLGLLGVLP